ncbi:MAG: hypothetical protein HY619_00115 [Thaumarchaeota archaeon]|nr:hypothetical protein [Nitrososphaerota archaeon]
MMAESLLSGRDRKLLMETKRVLDEVLETQEILSDKELMKSIENSKQDLKAGRTVTWEQLKRELKSRGKL